MAKPENKNALTKGQSALLSIAADFDAFTRNAGAMQVLTLLLQGVYTFEQLDEWEADYRRAAALLSYDDRLTLACIAAMRWSEIVEAHHGK
jgi:hypothetical protein